MGKLVRADCNCKGSAPQYRPRICPHHNHLVAGNGGPEEWDYEKNKGVRPEDVTPSAKKAYWYRCLNEECGESYPQTVNKRANGGTRCPYCVNQKVGSKNSLLAVRPDLCKEIDPECKVDPSKVVFGSKTVVTWICHKHDKPFRWKTPIQARTSTALHRGYGCPRCNQPGYDLRVGKHDEFLRICRELYGDKYSYPQPYIKTVVSINITCNAKDSDGKIHGDFSQAPERHMNGFVGCLKCLKATCESKLVKKCKAIFKALGYELGVDYFIEQTFIGLRNVCPLYFDFFFPQFNLCIEADGKQHFGMSELWGGDDEFRRSRQRDLIKDTYIIKNKINLLRIPHSTTPTEGLIDGFMELCATGQHIYATYSEFFEEVRKTTDMKGVVYSPVPL